MWTRTLHAGRRQLRQSHRTVRFSRKYNGQQFQGPHTTYFQPPPPKQPSRSWRILRTLLWTSTSFGLGAFAAAWIISGDLDDIQREIEEDLFYSANYAAAREVPTLDVPMATSLLELQSAYSVSPAAVSHTCQHGSNFPCEDTWSSGSWLSFGDPKKEWSEWSIFDGHAGSNTSQILRSMLPSAVGGQLYNANYMERPYVPNDTVIISAIQKAYQEVDKHLVDERLRLIKDPMPMFESPSPGVLEQKGECPLPLTDAVAIGAAAFSGSCALQAIYDPARSVLRVANVGDSRAVLGRWDAVKQKYIAIPMSVDHTGFNKDEVARLEREHPGEEVVDPKTGRVHGLAVSRAFGDARWKWTEDDTRLTHEKFWGPAPRPNGVIKTPPYLTAEPEVMETRVKSGERPDFLIMASDGLWDNMSSDVAVSCVQAWLDKNKPTDFLTEQPQPDKKTWLDMFIKEPYERQPEWSSDEERIQYLESDDDTYYDHDERCQKWKVEPKHFVVEDTNCGVHMIKNALGGKRRNLFTGVMTVQPPLSRYVRDDITVHVIFFGQDVQTPADRHLFPTVRVQGALN